MKPKKNSEIILDQTQMRVFINELKALKQNSKNYFTNPDILFPLAIGILGDVVSNINSSEETDESLNALGQIEFAASFFDAYVNLYPDVNDKDFLLLLCSTAYYLNNQTGNSKVVLNRINSANFSEDILEKILFFLLDDKVSKIVSGSASLIENNVSNVVSNYVDFLKTGCREAELRASINNFLDSALESGTDRDSLLADCIGAILNKKGLNSIRLKLIEHTHLAPSQIPEFINASKSIIEFWPAQNIIGKANIFKGDSGVIQLPTGSGKTKSLEIILRSAFYSKRTNLAIIVAPFKALVHEISDDLTIAFREDDTIVSGLSDVNQADFCLPATNTNRIIVLTPEKLLFQMRQQIDFVKNCGVLILDEGHQFDKDERGFTYEILLTTLRTLLPSNSQKIIISAVLRNSEEIGDWFMGNRNIVKGDELMKNPNYYGFVHWRDNVMDLRVYSTVNKDEEPREISSVLEVEKYSDKTHPKRHGKFPRKDRSSSIALSLGLKLVDQGAVAIFVPGKRSAKAIADEIERLIMYEHNLRFPLDYSMSNEVKALTRMIDQNFGPDSSESKSAMCGIFFHTANIPNGLRIAEEYALRSGTIRFVVCTSTLAQGVNLPLKYLIVQSVYRFDLIDKKHHLITVREFQNLIGRTGRAGMYTEGRIIFADGEILENRYKKEAYFKLMNNAELEECVSGFIQIIRKVRLDSQSPMERKKIREELVNLLNDDIEFQILGGAIEILLLNEKLQVDISTLVSSVVQLAKSTLAYHQATTEFEKIVLEELFLSVANKILEEFPENEVRMRMARTCQEVKINKRIKKWILSNRAMLFTTKKAFQLFDILWKLVKLSKYNVNKELIISPTLFKAWMLGCPYFELLKKYQDSLGISSETQTRDSIRTQDMIDTFENQVSYKISFLIGGLIEHLTLELESYNEELIESFKDLQKHIKYGLPEKSQIELYEMGFADRPLAQQMSKLFGFTNESKLEIIDRLKADKNIAVGFLNEYPAYFQKQLENILE